MSLDDWRVEIDKIDAEIVKLLNRRARLCREIGRWKQKTGLPIVDLEREQTVLRNALLNSEGIISDLGLTRIFCEIIRESRNLQAEVWARDTLSQCFGPASGQVERTDNFRI